MATHPIATIPKTPAHLRQVIERLRTQTSTNTLAALYLDSTADVNLAVGDVVYASTAGNVALAVASGLATSKIVGVSMETTTALGASSIQTAGIVENPAWTLVTNSLYYLSSTTPGAITTVPNETVGNTIVVVGVAVSATKLLLLISTPILL